MCCASSEGDVVGAAGLVGSGDVVCLGVSSIVLIVLARVVRTVKEKGACHVIVLEGLWCGRVEGAAQGVWPCQLHMGGTGGEMRGEGRKQSGTKDGHGGGRVDLEVWDQEEEEEAAGAGPVARADSYWYSTGMLRLGRGSLAFMLGGL